MGPADGDELMDTETVPVIPIGEVQWRHAVRVRGRVRSMRVQPWQGIATLEVMLYDDTGGLVVVFSGRRRIPGVTLGAHMEVEGMANRHRGHLAIINPRYELLAGS